MRSRALLWGRANAHESSVAPKRAEHRVVWGLRRLFESLPTRIALNFSGTLRDRAQRDGRHQICSDQRPRNALRRLPAPGPALPPCPLVPALVPPWRRCPPGSGEATPPSNEARFGPKCVNMTRNALDRLERDSLLEWAAMRPDLLQELCGHYRALFGERWVALALFGARAALLDRTVTST
jgi:hypothetical protein